MKMYTRQPVASVPVWNAMIFVRLAMLSVPTPDMGRLASQHELRVSADVETKEKSNLEFATYLGKNRNVELLVGSVTIDSGF